MKIIFDSREEMDRVIKKMDCPSVYGFKDIFETEECCKANCKECFKRAVEVEVVEQMKLVCERYRVKYVLKEHGYDCKHSRVKNDLEDLEDFIIYLLNLDNYVSHEVVKEKIYEEPYKLIGVEKCI